MASIERTAYPRFRRVVTALELASLSPTEDEVVMSVALKPGDRSASVGAGSSSSPYKTR